MAQSAIASEWIPWVRPRGSELTPCQTRGSELSPTVAPRRLNASVVFRYLGHGSNTHTRSFAEVPPEFHHVDRPTRVACGEVDATLTRGESAP